MLFFFISLASISICFLQIYQINMAYQYYLFSRDCLNIIICMTPFFILRIYLLKSQACNSSVLTFAHSHLAMHVVGFICYVQKISPFDILHKVIRKNIDLLHFVLIYREKKLKTITYSTFSFAQFVFGISIVKFQAMH